MIFFCNAEGTINAVVSSPVYQGSNYANEVVFVAPFVPVSVVTVSFIKPNGEYTPAALMTVKELTGIKDEKGNAFNAWTYLVPEAYTEYSGILTAQFKVTNGNTVLATASSSFNVQKGVPNVTPEPPEDIYQQILSALSEVKQDIANLEDGTTEVGKAKEAEKAEQAEYYTTASGDKSVNTIEAQFSNKLDKQTGVPSYPQVYAVEGNTQKLIPVSNGSTIAPNDRIAQYTSSGALFTQPPEADSDTTNKGYVDGEIKKSNDEQMVINERIVEILDGIEIVKVNDLEYNLMVDETIKGTINIPKDQFLKSVSYDPETHVLTFIFLTSDGEVTTTIDMSSLVDVYQAGNGLTLANNTFSIKLDPSGNNALTLSAAGLMLDNTPLEKAAEDIEILNSDMPKSAKETGAFISGDNTLAGAKADVEVGSENLIPFPYARSGDTQDGVTWTVADDGTITATGTATGSSGLVIFFASETAPIPVNGQYTLSLNKQGEGANAVFAELEKDGAYQGGYYNDTTFSYQNSNITVIRILASAGYTYNCTIKPKFQVGAVATPYTPYLSEGTAVEVQACGKNLFDITTLKPPTTIDSLGGLSDIIQVTNGEMINPRPLYSNSAYINIPVNLIKGTYTISGECWIDLNDPQGYLVYIGMWDGKKAGGSINTTITPGQWTKVQYTYIVEDLHAFTLQFQQGGNTASDTCTLKVRNIQLEYGDKATFYAPYEGLSYPATVGETIEVEQYDRITNIFSNTTGAAVSTQFLQSTRYELDTKPVSLAGTYAERPTGTYPYVVLYTANDAGRTYRLERDTDGSVSSNWVNISSAGGTGGGFTPRGEWNSATTYNENDLVSLNGSSYICIEENTNATPASNPDKWMVNAEKGETGATGTTGPAGTDGHSVYTANDTCGATEIGQVCCMLKSSTNAKGIGDVIISQDGKVFTVTTENDTSWCGPITALIKGPQGEWGNGWYRVDTEISSSVVNVDRSKLYPAEPAIVREGETVVYADGHIGKINSQTGTTVSISVYSISLQGPQGPAGANGTNGTDGKDYLVYKDIPLNNSIMPSPTNYVNLDLNEFSRTPIIDENFTMVYRYGSNSVGIRNYYCVMRVVSISGTSVRCAFDDYVSLSRNIYEHHVTYTVSGTLVACFTVINTYKSAFATTGDLTSYMYPNCPYPVTGWYKESSSNVGWGLNLIITTGGSINFKFASATGEISYTADNDELVTDVVVEML